MVFETLRKLLVEKLDCEESEIAMESEFEALGVDSLDITELVMKLEDEYGIEIEVDETMKTVGDVVGRIEAILAEKKA